MARRLRRDWRDADAKLARERGQCRVAKLDPLQASTCSGPVQRAHLVPREHDRPDDGTFYDRIVDADNICPLCEHHHKLFDTHQLDLLPYLDLREQGYVAGVLGLMGAFHRLTGLRRP
jgi:hypothetical protein